MPRPRPLLLVALLATPLVATPTRGADTADGAAAYLPDDLIFVATLRDGDRQVQTVRTLLDTYRFTESSTYERLTENPEITQARMFAVGLADTAGTDPWSGLGALLGRETVLGIAPGDADGPRFIVASVPRERARTDAVLDALYAATGLRRGDRPDPDRSRTVDGITVYTLGDGVVHCRLDEAVVLASHADLLQAAITAHRHGAGRLAESVVHRRAAARASEGAAAWAYGDMTVVRPILEQTPDGVLLPNPLAALLFGGWWHALRHADHVDLDVTPGPRRLALAVHVDGTTPAPDPLAGFDPPVLRTPRWSPDDVPDTLAAITVARDWDDLFAERESLMTLAAASDFVNFTSTLTALMGSVDFVDDVLARVDGPVRLVAARQHFDDRPYRPTPEIPAVALVIPLDLDDATGLGRRLDSAALTAFGIINADAGRKNQPTYVVDLQPHGRHRLVVASRTAPEDEEGDDEADGPASVGVEYNFEPSTVVLDEHYLVATSPALLRDLIDAIEAAPPGAASDGPPPDRVTLSGPRLVELLRANRAALVMNAMLEDDKPRAVATREFELLFDLLDYVERVDLDAARDVTAPSARLVLELRAPAIAAPAPEPAPETP